MQSIFQGNYRKENNEVCTTCNTEVNRLEFRTVSALECYLQTGNCQSCQDKELEE